MQTKGTSRSIATAATGPSEPSPPAMPIGPSGASAAASPGVSPSSRASSILLAAKNAGPAHLRRSPGRVILCGMPLYLTKFSYTPETWARLIRNPEDRRRAAESYIESVGGQLHGFWYAFGGHD